MTVTPGPWFAAELIDGDTRQAAVIGPDSIDPDGLHWETVVCRCESWADAEAIAGMPDRIERLTLDLARAKGLTVAQARQTHIGPHGPQPGRSRRVCQERGMNAVDGATEPGGHGAMWDGGGGWV